ncbi:MAG: 30S ribosomal protein S9 [bacterium]
MTKKEKYLEAVGRRKTAVARVRLYLKTKKLTAKIKGGGVSSQEQAVKLGLARVLIKYKPDLKQSLRAAGLLTRDPREVERKKPGRKKARRRPQWSKR